MLQEVTELQHQSTLKDPCPRNLVNFPSIVNLKFLPEFQPRWAFPPSPSIRMFPRDSFRRLVSLFRFSHDVGKISLISHARRRLPCWAFRLAIGCVNALASFSQMNQFLGCRCTSTSVRASRRCPRRAASASTTSRGTTSASSARTQTSSSPSTASTRTGKKD